MGSTPRGNGTILRRSLSQSCGETPPGGVINNKMQGHQNRNSGAGVQFMQHGGAGNGGTTDQLMSPPFPPPPPSEVADVGGSNNTTPRGSMEFLPPPPPHLLQSDEEGDNDVATTANENKNDNNGSLSVSESVRKLQQRHHSMINNQNAHAGMRPGSPATLRRVQSMSAATPPQNTPVAVFNSSLQHHQMDHGQRASLKARLEAAMSTPRAQAPGSMAQHRPQSPNPASGAGGNNEVIYAPVAALQQKIQQQHQKAAAAAGHGGPGGNMMMNPGMVPHPPGPVFQQQVKYCFQ